TFPNFVYTDPVNYLTPVGAFASSPSSYGTYDQLGLVQNWTETIGPGGNEFRELIGSSWITPVGGNGLSKDHRPGLDGESPVSGFRVALVPEPSTLALGVVGLLVVGVAIAFRRLGC